MEDRESAQAMTRGDLDLTVCEACGFIFNRAFTLEKIMYGEGYDNTQSYSLAFNEYLDGLVRHMVMERDVRDCRIVEVGCGKGTFLRKLIEFEGANNTGYGFDPSYTDEETALNGRLRFESRYYDQTCADVEADVVVCRHVIEHVPDPLELLCSIRKALVNSPKARVFFETPCVEWILRNHVIWDFFYEHCSYFTAQSLATVFQLAGFRVESVERVFGGQYLWLEASLYPEGAETKVVLSPQSILDLAREFARREDELRGLWSNLIRDLSARETIALWGAGAKGVTFANLVDPERRWINCVVDLNPQKQGHYIPGTGHPIIDYRDLAKRRVTTAILMNPNYLDENLTLLKESGQNVRLIQESSQLVSVIG
ncbi:MAG TPA: class I SAM-dependent methyltransferase [Pyrinomonadaceae bacterium]|nr:class I SAM-dependent methyltransferase [Pyrinomonadaceae bacterium]